MVSLWPWKKDDSSPASFEKSLSTLSAKIAATQARLDQTRTSSRRLRVLSTLYLSFAYLVYAIVALLVVGWKNMGAYEWSGMAFGPVFIYLIRTIFSTIYDLRIENLGSRLKDQQAERAKTIQKLKEATRYDSTLELLEKYGGGDTKIKENRHQAPEEGQFDDSIKKSPGRRQQQQNPNSLSHTTLTPPPTANIQRPVTHQGTRQPPGTGPYNSLQQQERNPPADQHSRLSPDTTAEFSPNAYDTARRSSWAQYDTAADHHWYDRIMDLLLGEDETASRNRLVLLCTHCRLVNGQAPPGTSNLAELGVWRCMACGATNGDEDEGNRLVKEVLTGRQRNGEKASDVTGKDKNTGRGDGGVGEEDTPSVKKREGKEGG